MPASNSIRGETIHIMHVINGGVVEAKHCIFDKRAIGDDECLCGLIKKKKQSTSGRPLKSLAAWHKNVHHTGTTLLSESNWK